MKPSPGAASDSKPRQSNRVKLFKRLVSAKHDFAAAREAAGWLMTHYAELHTGIAYRAIETGIVVSYARPFGQNDGLGSLAAEFRKFTDTDAQHVHDRLLFARRVQEAHNDVSKRGRLINSIPRTDDPLNIKIEITEDGSTFWDLGSPSLAVGELNRLTRMIAIQEERLAKAIASTFEAMLAEKQRSPGTYHLGLDFP